MNVWHSVTFFGKADLINWYGDEVSVDLMDATRAKNRRAVLMPTDPDAMLVVATRNEKPAAFEELIGRYERRIVRLAQNVTQNREDAEEVTQEAFFRAFAHPEGFKGDSRFSTWLTRCYR